MSNIWDKVYSNDSAFFGEEPSDFAQKCYSNFKRYDVKRLLELGCGQGRDTIFFASNGFDVHAIDASKVAIENINQKIRQKNISLDLRHFKVRQSLPYDNSYFDAVYSHMFYNMRFTDEELGFLFKESNRVLKNNGLLYFSVRNDKDVSYNKGKKIDNYVYEINGFQIRFFTTRQIQLFLENYFEIKNIEESYEEPVNLYFDRTTVLFEDSISFRNVRRFG
ncbi:MAG: class I SAM-dependent methyltransferase [Nitrososphaeraceae archaeon]|nr:class I SAM-dependent methyltransferase [Nitrososphaeraceae archaeon]